MKFKIRTKKALICGLWAFFFFTGSNSITVAQDLGNASQEESFQAKAQQIIDFTADTYQPPSKDIGDPEKYYWPKAMARFEKYGLEDSQANEWIAEFSQRSPFHFTLVGMVRLMGKYGNSPQMDELKSTYLKKVFERTDGYNFKTSEGTENHNNMSRTSGYLYSQWALSDKTSFPMAEASLNQMSEWIIWYAQKMYKTGNGEWNSGIYEVYNMIGWANLYDFATEPKIKAMARAVLDFYALEMALYYSFGSTGGPEMRGNGAGKGHNSTTAWLAWLWFGGNTEKQFSGKGSEPIQVMHFITSSYRPPQAIIELAQQKEKSQGLYKISRPDYLLSKGAEIDIAHFIHTEFTLGSCRSPYGGYAGSAYQMVPWKAVIANSSDANKPFEISGSGRFFSRTDGGARDPYTQIVQSDKALIQMTLTPINHKKILEQLSPLFIEWENKWRRDYEARFPGCEKLKHKVVNEAKEKLAEPGSYLTFPAEFKFQLVSGWNYGKLGNCYVVFRSLNTSPIQVAEKQGRKVIEELSAAGTLSGWVLELVPVSDFKSEQEFVQALTKVKGPEVNSKTLIVRFKGIKANLIEAQFTASGSYSEPLVDWGFGTKVQQIFQTTPPFTQPKWPSGVGFGKMPKIIKGHTPLKEGEITIGPSVNFTNGIMDINVEGGSSYQVNFTKDDPVFSE